MSVVEVGRRGKSAMSSAATARFEVPKVRPPPPRNKNPTCARPRITPLFSEKREEKGTPVGVVYRAQGPALGSWGDRLPAGPLPLLTLIDSLLLRAHFR